MEKIVECVPNFSEGRDMKVIEEIVNEIKNTPDVYLLDVDPGEATNRTVVTFVGSPEGVKEAAFKAIKKAAELIDMREHHGAHPRMGATDVCPFVPVKGVTMEDCVRLAEELGKRVGEELGIPVYLYEYAAREEYRRNLADIREGEYEALPDKLKNEKWKPDFGPAEFNEHVAKTGATVIGARDFLIAYNVNLNTTDKKLAHKVAKIIREKGYKKKMPDGTKQQIPGRLKNVKAIGWYIDEYKRAQISINLTNFHETPLWKVFEVAEEEANKLGLRVTGSEIVGLIPLEAMLDVGRHFLKKQGKSTAVPEVDIVHEAILSLGLNDVAKFDPEEKIIEYKIEKMESRSKLVDMRITEFADELSRNSPAPGGGSVAALNGALSASLISMVAALTHGKKKYKDVWEDVEKIGNEAQSLKHKFIELIDRDTEAFDAFMAAMKLPKKTEEEKMLRAAEMEKATKHAIEIPMETLRSSIKLVELAAQIAEKGNKNALSDAGVAALTAYSAAYGAYLNVKINLAGLSDEEYKEKTAREASEMLEKVSTEYREVLKKVEEQL
ncbi:MAG: glutamate formimidoyltransferase [Euryarchaeota archaeon]|nr:glutamate formimidoyltransferase [Euryarchaeota archaeon]